LRLVFSGGSILASKPGDASGLMRDSPVGEPENRGLAGIVLTGCGGAIILRFSQGKCCFLSTRRETLNRSDAYDEKRGRELVLTEVLVELVYGQQKDRQ
jgi:hypothetical protein